MGWTITTFLKKTPKYLSCDHGPLIMGIDLNAKVEQSLEQGKSRDGRLGL